MYKNFSNYDNRKCYFHVYNDDLQHGMRFENYKRYKLQIRLISNTYDGTINETELNKNLQYLTEWSTICIISFISQPYIELDNTSINYEEDIINLNATLKHSDSSSQDYLTGYKLYLRDETSGII